MVRHTMIKTALWIVVVAASMSAVSAQPGPSGAEMPTGDVWPSHAGETYVPRRAIPPRTGDDVDPSSGTVPLSLDKFAHEQKCTPASQIKLDITLTVPPRRAASARHRVHRACR
jgi:hypothetical protein